MSTAHTDNEGMQYFSATQTPEQIQKAISGDGNEYEFESTMISTAPLAPPVEEKKPEAQAEPEVTEQPKRKNPGKYERRLARAQREMDTLREENTKRAIELAELRGMIAGKASAASPVPVVAPVVQESAVVEPTKPEAPQVKTRPHFEEFADSDNPQLAYEDAVAEWNYEKRRAKEKSEEESRSRQEAEKATKAERDAATDAFSKRWNTSIEEAKTVYKDFDKIIAIDHFDKEGKPLPIVSGPMSHVAQNRKAGAKILYWLGTHPEQANEICRKTNVAKTAAPWEIEEAFSEVRRAFDQIEQELSKPIEPDTKGQAQPAVKEVVDDIDDDEEDEQEDSDIDPNLPVVADPSAGKNVAQQPPSGTVDTKAPVASIPKTDKSDPVARVGNRQTHVNRDIRGTPPEVLKQLTPEEYRRQRKLEGSPAAKG